MLFSNRELASWIDDNFEPVWESVRPVPTVRFEFGATAPPVVRTLHGNTATHICTPHGEVIDILPGVYDPESYRRELEALLRVAGNCRGASSAVRESTIAAYHSDRLTDGPKTAKKADLEERFSGANRTFPSKFAIELPVERALGSKVGRSVGGAADREFPFLEGEVVRYQDRLRPVIHRRLLKVGPVAPSAITPWLYRSVLESDLRDPHLGLGPLLLESDPFRGAVSGAVHKSR